MRLHNKHKYTYFKAIYLLMALALGFDLVIMNIEGSLGSLSHLWPAVMLLGLFLVWRGLPVFEYDSDGEVLIFTAKEPFFLPFSRAFVSHTEFPKRKLRGYRIKNFPFRRIISVSIASKEGFTKKVSIPISYLNKEDVRDLERSLNGVLKKNKDQKLEDHPGDE